MFTKRRSLSFALRYHFLFPSSARDEGPQKAWEKRGENDPEAFDLWHSHKFIKEN
jgi:hypothetical protein